VIAVLAVAVADLCGPVTAAAPDGHEAAIYVEVADEAAAVGDARVAAIAYRRALELDAGNAHARAALDALCRQDRPGRRDDASELLAAIARFHAGELDDAERALRDIASRDDAQAGAHLFLGLIALRQHAGRNAVDELELARRDPVYAELAVPLLRLAHRDGALAARVLVAPELDTNPQLLPDTPPVGADTGAPRRDADLIAVASVTARPTRWMVVRDTLSWRQQVRVRELDLLGEHAEAGLELEHHRDHVGARYELDDDLLAGDAYLFANGGTLTARRELAGFALAASYTLRHRAFQRATEMPFTGWVQHGEAGAIVHVTPTFDLEAMAIVRREHTRDPLYAFIAAGGRVGVRARLGADTRLAGAATSWYAHYDGAEPDGQLRRDGNGELAIDVERDLGDYVLATCGATVIGNASTVEDFQYWKLVLRCGLAVAFGGR
jgi:hypothetical protein